MTTFSLLGGTCIHVSPHILFLLFIFSHNLSSHSKKLTSKPPSCHPPPWLQKPADPGFSIAANTGSGASSGTQSGRKDSQDEGTGILRGLIEELSALKWVSTCSRVGVLICSDTCHWISDGMLASFLGSQAWPNMRHVYIPGLQCCDSLMTVYAPMHIILRMAITARHALIIVMPWPMIVYSFNLGLTQWNAKTQFKVVNVDHNPTLIATSYIYQ